MEKEYRHNNKVAIYRSADGETQLSVEIDKDTVWLNANQMAELFGRDSKTIRKHINNAIREELAGEVVVAKFATTTQHGAMEAKSQTHDVNFYNLDVIISVGYRVKSKNGVDFRRWANKVLKEYLVKGYAVNKSISERHYTELKQLVAVLSRTIRAQETLSSEDAVNLVEVISDYTYALDTLDKYDYQELSIERTTNEEKFHATYEGAMQAINELKNKFGGSKWFANEKDDSFKSSVGQIYQTFDGVELYPSVEEKAAMLLYLVVKNHSFSDGNKRIAAMLFLWFLDRNGILYSPNGGKRIADNTLVALTLMIAESRTEEKDVMVKVVVTAMQNFAAIDFETANNERSSVCSIGIVIVRGEEIVDTFYSLIKPEPEYYNYWCSQVHGLCSNDTTDAPIFPEVWKQIEPLIKGLPLVAHNKPFDESCLKAVFRVYQMDYPDYEFYDTLCASRQAFPELENHQLHTVAATCGYQLENHHHALADAEACAWIAREIL